MRFLSKVLMATAIGCAVASSPVAFARDDMDANIFVRKAATSKDGMVTKAEVMKMVEEAFDKQDKKKEGKLDKKQVEFFLKELMKSGG